MLNSVDKTLLKQVADLHEIPRGAYNIRKDGMGFSYQSSANIEIVPKSDKPGIDILIKPETKNESVHIPVILSETGIEDMVYNTFDIGENAEVTIIAGCGIHNAGDDKSQHDGIHEFIVRKGAKVNYIEKHYGEGKGKGENIMNPKTFIELDKQAQAEMELVQIEGVDNTRRETEARLQDEAYLMINEKMLTGENQFAEALSTIILSGENSSAQLISRSVGKGSSEQLLYPKMIGEKQCRGHVECDAIIMDTAQIRSIPEISANHADAQLVHEAAIGKIQDEQLMKLMSLGLSEEEAEEKILQGFLR